MFVLGHISPFILLPFLQESCQYFFSPPWISQYTSQYLRFLISAPNINHFIVEILNHASLMFELNHPLTLNFSQATQLHNSISSAHRYVFKAICEVCEFYFKHWQLQWLGFVYRVTLLDCRFCFEKIFMCVLNFSQNFLRERKITSVNVFLPPTRFVFSLRSWLSLSFHDFFHNTP